MLVNTEPPTMPGVFLDRGAYSAPARPGADSAHPAALPTTRTAVAIDVALRCGIMLLARGAATVDAESAVYAVARAYGLEQVEVDVLYNAISLSTVVDGLPVSATRVARVVSPDYRRWQQIHRVVVEITEQGLDLATARTKVAALERIPKPYPRWVVGLARAVTGAGIAVTLGGGWQAAVAGFLVSLLLQQVIGLVDVTRWPEFFLNVVGGFMAGLFAGVITLTNLDVTSALVVAAGIVILLPGLTLVTAVRDALVGFPTTAAGRGIQVVVLISGIVAGVLGASGLLGVLGVEIGAVPPVRGADTVLVRTAAAAVVGTSFAVSNHAAGLVLPTSLVTGAGFLAYTGGVVVSDSAIIGTAVAALLVGMLGTLLGRAVRTPSLIIVVPAIVPLLPGLTIYRGVVELTSGATVEGLVTLLNAVVIALAIAAGALAGELLVTPRRRGQPDRGARPA
jgi:uncharacterized membrane protein YjjP (DUF1212 family)